MRCKICDSVMDKPVWNRLLQDWEVCGTCLEIIHDVFAGEDLPDNLKEEAPEDIEIEEEVINL